MKWVDVCGAPGSGKSTLCDPLWGPHELPIEDRLPPKEWHDFLNEITRLFILIRSHWSYDAAIRMNNRSIRKIATVARSEAVNGKDTYIQTGLVQRGLGFGWRLNDLGIPLDELEDYFRLMPVSLGVAITECPTEEIIKRNHAREKIKKTAHENRDFMVALMLPAVDVARRVLVSRGVPIIDIRTDTDPEEGRGRLISFAATEASKAAPIGRGCEVEVLSAPAWFLR